MASMGLTVAVTRPTGEIGISAVSALERDPNVDRIVGMSSVVMDTAKAKVSLAWTPKFTSAQTLEALAQSRS